MKKLLALSALALLLGGCGSEPVEDDNELIDMMGEEEVTEDSEASVSPEEEPYSAGPSEIPSDLVPNDQD